MSTKLLIAAVTLNAVIGQLLLKHALATLGGRSALQTMGKLISDAVASPWVYASIVFQGLGFFLWMTLISREKLGVATASVGAGFYIIMPLCAWAIYGETLSKVQWAGIGLLILGVACVSMEGA